MRPGVRPRTLGMIIALINLINVALWVVPLGYIAWAFYAEGR